MTKWEYLSCSLRMKGLNNWVGSINGEEVRGVDEVCNFYGQDGWELVSFAPSGVVTTLVFKRPQTSAADLAPKYSAAE